MTEEIKLTKISPKYAPSVVQTTLQQLNVFDGETMWWSAGRMANHTGINYKHCQIILERFYLDRLAHRQTRYGGMKVYRIV